MRSEILIGSRGSDLALWQANFVKDKLEALGHQVRIIIIKTQGDRIQHLSFDKMEGKGFFTKELEQALLSKKVDLAVHSCKDLETNHPEGLTIAANSSRANPADLLLVNPDFYDEGQLWNLAKNARVGTSSARRKVQLKERRPDIELLDIRGNVPTRVGKLRDGNFDAIVLAKAGIDRLEFDYSDLKAFEFSPEEFIPAPAQGVLALQTRSDDRELIEVLRNIHNEEVGSCISIERKVLNLFDGGCQLPLGAYCTEKDGKYDLRVAMARTVNHSVIRAEFKGDSGESLAERAVEALKKKVPA